MKPSASHLELAYACPYAFSGRVRVRESESGPEAQLGHAFHTIPQAHFNGEPVPFTDQLAKDWNLSDDQAERLERMRRGFFDSVVARRPHVRQRAEVAYAYDPETGTARMLPQQHHRDYSAAAPQEFVGTLDLEGFNVDGTLVVSDAKTGQRRYVMKPKSNPQLRMLALAAARFHGRDEVVVELHWWDDEGNVDIEDAFFDSFDLAAIAGELAGLDLAMADPAVQPRTGPHCTFCHAVADCPETNQALAQLSPPQPPEHFRVVTTAAEIQSPEHATWLLNAYQAVLKAAEVVRKAALEPYADQHGGILTGDGSRWARHEIPTDQIKLTPEGRQLLEQDLPGSVQFTATKGSIEDAARAAKRPIQKTKDVMVARLRELGCVRTSTTVKYEDR